MNTLKFFIGFALIAAALSVKTSFDEFKEFKAKFGKRYLTKAEDVTRYRIFKENLDYINKHNELATKGVKSYTMAVNQFADLTNKEYREQVLGATHRADGRKYLLDSRNKKVSSASSPDEIDWADQGYVTKVQDQGQCGSCWAFSAIGSIEGAYYKKTGDLVNLSEQQLVDCDTQSNAGCNGGWMTDAFDYVIKNGVDTEESYPYHAADEKCKADQGELGATITGYEELDMDEENIKDAVAANGPVSVAIDAGQLSFQFYSHGVYYEPDCYTFFLNHGVLVTGYGTEDGDDYWLVKNSWGTGWGDSGYIKMSRNKECNCGICTNAAYAIA